jgi:hypothetical protein
MSTHPQPRASVSTSGKIALVTLIQSSESEFLQPSELVEQIRRDLERGKLPKTWSIEKIAVLEESQPNARVLRSSREDDLTIP